MKAIKKTVVRIAPNGGNKNNVTALVDAAVPQNNNSFLLVIKNSVTLSVKLFGAVMPFWVLLICDEWVDEMGGVRIFNLLI